jgi:hypothetical protein
MPGFVSRLYKDLAVKVRRGFHLHRIFPSLSSSVDTWKAGTKVERSLRKKDKLLLSVVSWIA